MKSKSAQLLFPDAVQVQLDSGLRFSTRVAAPSDLEPLDELYTRNMKSHVERVASWDPHVFRANYEPRKVELIEISGRQAGFLRLELRKDVLYLAELQIDKLYQGRGIGGAVLEKLIEKARKHELLITLKVIHGNPAEFFYRRYGFREFKRSALHLHMSVYPGGNH